MKVAGGAVDQMDRESVENRILSKNIARITLEGPIYDRNPLVHSLVLDGSNEGRVDLLQC